MGNAAFIGEYFAGESIATWVLMLLGAASLATALWLLLHRRHALFGMAWPLLVIGTSQFALGATLHLRNEALAESAQHRFATQPLSFRIVEVERMRERLDSLGMMRASATALLALGMALPVLLRRQRFWVAFGLALVLHGGAALVLLHFAEGRAQLYLTAVRAT